MHLGRPALMVIAVAGLVALGGCQVGGPVAGWLLGLALALGLGPLVSGCRRPGGTVAGADGGMRDVARVEEDLGFHFTPPDVLAVDVWERCCTRQGWTEGACPVAVPAPGRRFISCADGTCRDPSAGDPPCADAGRPADPCVGYQPDGLQRSRPYQPGVDAGSEWQWCCVQNFPRLCPRPVPYYECNYRLFVQDCPGGRCGSMYEACPPPLDAGAETAP
jgi:hypothetical protein